MPSDAAFLVIPTDTLWLRGGRPFRGGEESYDPGLFPPTPWTFQGLIRTHVLHERLGEGLARASRTEIEGIVGPPDRLPPGWQIEGPFPARILADGKVEPWVPCPRFLRPGRSWRAPPERSRRMPGAATEGILAREDGEWLGAPGHPSGPLEGWISARNLAWALAGWGAWRPVEAAFGSKHAGGALPPFVAPETRPGVVLRRSDGSAEDHMLYAGVHHRFAPRSGIYGALRGADLDVDFRGGAFMGRRNRTVSLQRARTVREWDSLRLGDQLRLSEVPDPLHLRLVLLSPALVRRKGEVAPLELPRGARIMAVEADAGPDIGGFDRIGHGSRAARSTWAAGSTWWIRIEGGSPEDRLEAARSLQGLGPHRPDDFERFGFGQRLVAAFDPETGSPLSPEEPSHA